MLMMVKIVVSVEPNKEYCRYQKIGARTMVQTTGSIARFLFVIVLQLKNINLIPISMKRMPTLLVGRYHLLENGVGGLLRTISPK